MGALTQKSSIMTVLQHKGHRDVIMKKEMGAHLR